MTPAGAKQQWHMIYEGICISNKLYTIARGCSDCWSVTP